LPVQRNDLQALQKEVPHLVGVAVSNADASQQPQEIPPVAKEAPGIVSLAGWL
jgi:hypothetical protein